MSRPNAMSVDVEEHYHAWALSRAIPRERWGEQPSRVVASTERVLELFEEAGVKATFFTLGCVAERHPQLVRRIVAAGHELASHGQAHYRVGEQDRAAFLEDVRRSRLVLEDTGGAPVAGYRAASFSVGPSQWWAYDCLLEAGYRYSSSMHPIRHDHYGIPAAPRWPFAPIDEAFCEIPVATVELAGRRASCAGGGFFRILPYAWSRVCLDRHAREAAGAAVFYFHPWEIDQGQPRVGGIGFRSRLRHYANLGRMEAKLKRLLRRYDWDRIDRVFAFEAAELPRWSPDASP
jgi:polysaccharide deacetylase family protein (PEP-CTERM system associated)